jgi:hypothetical protein
MKYVKDIAVIYFLSFIIQMDQQYNYKVRDIRLRISLIDLLYQPSYSGFSTWPGFSGALW